MVIHAYGHTRTYEMEALLKLFRPAEKFSFSDAENLPDDAEYISAVYLPEQDGNCRLLCRTSLGGDTREAETVLPAPVSGNALDREISGLLYPQLCALTGIQPAWGMLTGIRPVNLLRKFAERRGSLKQAMTDFREIWHVSADKTLLAVGILSVQKPILDAAPQNGIGLYVSVPFCPTRCRYCSFVSNSVSQMKQKLLPEYLKRLHEEMQMTADLICRYGLQIDTVYVGGGTPTVLSAAELESLLQWIAALLKQCGSPKLREYTVEAGRPDTITEEKLLVMRRFGVNRISVNPQSFQDAVLEAAGRPHSAQDAIEKFALAQKTGFDNINMDLIAGLPCDTAAGFRESIDRAVSLSPASITVHCLALKKAADFYQNLPMPDADTVSDMVAYAEDTLTAAGYRPYYLYRQKNMAANLENVGYAKPGFESAYNIMMMDDSQTILGVGAGASTKVIGGARGIERLTECKYPYDYLARFDELMQQKTAQLTALL